MKWLSLVILAPLLLGSLAEAAPTRVVVRAKAKDAKFIGSTMGALVIVRESDTGAVLAKGSIASTHYSERLDYELEFGVFIGRPGKDISAKEARRHIAGYTVYNDVSARDMQGREMELRLGPAKGKDFDNSNTWAPAS